MTLVSHQFLMGIKRIAHEFIDRFYEDVSLGSLCVVVRLFMPYSHGWQNRPRVAPQRTAGGRGETPQLGRHRTRDGVGGPQRQVGFPISVARRSQVAYGTWRGVMLGLGYLCMYKKRN